MNYNDEIISFFSTTLSGWDVTGYHLKSLFIIIFGHNFGHNLNLNSVASFITNTMKTQHTIKFGNSCDLQSIKDCSVDLVVTSPPYSLTESEFSSSPRGKFCIVMPKEDIYNPVTVQQMKFLNKNSISP